MVKFAAYSDGIDRSETQLHQFQKERRISKVCCPMFDQIGPIIPERSAFQGRGLWFPFHL
jgi:hypothetical protein